MVIPRGSLSHCLEILPSPRAFNCWHPSGPSWVSENSGNTKNPMVFHFPHEAHRSYQIPRRVCTNPYPFIADAIQVSYHIHIIPYPSISPFWTCLSLIFFPLESHFRPGPGLLFEPFRRQGGESQQLLHRTDLHWKGLLKCGGISWRMEEEHMVDWWRIVDGI